MKRTKLEKKKEEEREKCEEKEEEARRRKYEEEGAGRKRWFRLSLWRKIEELSIFSHLSILFCMIKLTTTP